MYQQFYNPYNNPQGMYQQNYPQGYQQNYPQQANHLQNSFKPSISGRVVSDISEVTAQEVPMDGSVSFFPKSDYSCIYAKVWNGNGTISTFKFVPEQPISEEKPSDFMAIINERFDKLEKMITPVDIPAFKEG